MVWYYPGIHAPMLISRKCEFKWGDLVRFLLFFYGDGFSGFHTHSYTKTNMSCYSRNSKYCTTGDINDKNNMSY